MNRLRRIDPGVYLKIVRSLCNIVPKIIIAQRAPSRFAHLSNPDIVLDRYWRIFATGLSFVLFGLFALVLGVLLGLLVFPLPASAPRKERWTRRVIQGALWLYVRTMRFLGLLTFDISGQENAIQSESGQGTLVIANHPSLLDVVFLLSAIPNVNCIVKAALWRNPFTYFIVNLAGFIRNDREDMLEVAGAQIRSGQRLLVFPEGTRTADPERLDLKRGSAHAAIAGGGHFTPVIIRCEPLTLRKNEAWYNVPSTPPHFTLTILPGQHIDDCIDTSRPRPVQVRRLTRDLEAILAMQP